MLKSFKWCSALLAAVVITTIASSEANAGIAFLGTLDQWKNKTDPVKNDDKDFAFVDASDSILDANPDVSIKQVGTEYTITFGFGVGGQDGPFDGWVIFSVVITNPLKQFNQINIDSTHLGSGSSWVRKDIDWGGTGVDASIQSTNGSTDSTLAAAGQTALAVMDTMHITAGANIASFVNTFTQQDVPVPEPTTVAFLVGFGAIGLVSRIRRKGN